MGWNPAKQGIALKGLNKSAQGQRSAALGSERPTLSIRPLKGVHKCSGQRPLGNIIQLSGAQNLKLTAMRASRDQGLPRKFSVRGRKRALSGWKLIYSKAGVALRAARRQLKGTNYLGSMPMSEFFRILTEKGPSVFFRTAFFTPQCSF
jgi:hypothetical protein